MKNKKLKSWEYFNIGHSLLDIRYYLFGVLLVLRAEEYLADDAFFVNDKSGAEHTHIFMAEHDLFVPYTIFINDGMFGIGDQCKRELVFGFKFLMLFFIVGAYADHFKTMLF